MTVHRFSSLNTSKFNFRSVKILLRLNWSFSLEILRKKMNITQAKKVLDNLYMEYPALKMMDAVRTAAFVRRTLSKERQDEIEQAAKAYENAYLLSRKAARLN